MSNTVTKSLPVQNEITKSTPLLDDRGNLKVAGYARKLLPVYNRNDIRANKLRIKEWDYYLIANDHYAVALTIADNSYMGLDSITFLNFDEPWQKTVSLMQILTMGKKNLPSSSSTGNVSVMGKNYRISFCHQDGKRILDFQMDPFYEGKPISGLITLDNEPEESMVIATPFRRKGHFYFNQKINCMTAEGVVKLGEAEYVFSPEDSFAVLDWGRGVWTYSNTWYWGSASGTVDGVPFGFNIGYGFGDTSAATENMLFYDGKAHKLSNVSFNIPLKEKGKEDYLKKWTFTSDDKRFEMEFEPIIDRASCTSVVVIKSDQHQVFGRFSGNAVLDDGKIISIKDFIGFAEKVKNRW
ncbi:MAG: DUF2804 domain-containing protein [Eubacteriales bacterium]